MYDVLHSVPAPYNEPVLDYAPGSRERADLKRALASLSGSGAVLDLPMRVGGRELASAAFLEVRAPHEHGLLLARAHRGGAEHMAVAVEAALAARDSWSNAPFAARAAVFLRAAELLTTRHRALLNAATMLGQSKTAHQAEIDAACELADFWRFNVAFAARAHEDQPSSSRGVWNALDLRPLEGFVLAVTPFNFTAIAGNLPSAPALMGNTVVWKPAVNAAYSAHFVMQILEEAGLPAGVINLVQGDPGELVSAAVAHPELAGIHFTGSTEVFRNIWQQVSARIGDYRNFPRLVGETGGKDFVVAHASADVDALAVALVRGAFEYQGQKCSAASRAYIPRSLAPALRERVTAAMREIRVGNIADFRNFMGAVIDRRAFERITGYLGRAARDPSCTVLSGGGASDREGYFVEPTLIETTNAHHELMREEIFGPVLAMWVYADEAYDAALDVCDTTTPYALTGAVFARDRAAIAHAQRRLRHAAGNFYVNDKPTGAVVGQQPFGGGRASGTNDKAGSAQNLMRWVSPRAIKETFAPPIDVPYPFMGAE